MERLRSLKKNKEFIGTESLLICPSLKWGSIERRVLKDAIYQKNLGVIPTIYCFEKSVLSSFAVENEIKVIHSQNKKINKLFDFKYLFELRRILKSSRYNFVHCFNTRYVWMIALALRSHKRIPFFLTVDKRVNYPFKGLLYKWLLARVDRVFTFSHTMIDIVPSFLDIPRSKVKFSGLGVSEKPMIKESPRILVAIVSEGQVESLESFIVQILNLLRTKDLKLMLYYDRSVEFKDKVHKIKDIIISLQAGEVVGLRKYDAEDSCFQKNRIFINLSTKESITDHEVSALIRNTLVLSARSLSRSNMSRIFFGALQTYKLGDNRGFMDALEFLITNGNEIIEKLDAQRGEALFYHGEVNYFELLTKHFLKMSKLRFRFNRSKKA